MKMKNKNNNFLKAGGIGITSAMFYSLTPLFVFFFASSEMKITYAIFLATIQELMSFILVGLVLGFQKWRKKSPNFNDSWLNYTLILPVFYMLFVGIYDTTINLIKKLKNLRIWIMSGVGLLAGPISMALLMISALYLNDGTLGNAILNTAPIYCMILTRIILKDKINKTALIGIIFTGLMTFGMVLNYFFIQESINWKLIVGVILSFIAALAYAFESLTSDYFLHNKQKQMQLTNYEVVSVKSFVSFWIMLIVILPIASLIDTQPFYKGWTIFKISFDSFKWQALLIYGSGIIMGIGRLLYFEAVKFSSGTYALATQLTMLIWTPILQILGNLLIPSIETNKLEWYYWLWSTLILIGLIFVTFNENIQQFLKKKIKKNNSNN